MKLIPSPDDFGAAMNRPGFGARIEAIQRLTKDKKFWDKYYRVAREQMSRPTPFLKDFPEIDNIANRAKR